MTKQDIIERAKRVSLSSNPKDYIEFVGELAKENEKSNSLTSELEGFAQDFESYYDTGASPYLNCVRGDIKNAVIAGAKKQQQLMIKQLMLLSTPPIF